MHVSDWSLEKIVWFVARGGLIVRCVRCPIAAQTPTLGAGRKWGTLSFCLCLEIVLLLPKLPVKIDGLWLWLPPSAREAELWKTLIYWLEMYGAVRLQEVKMKIFQTREGGENRKHFYRIKVCSFLWIMARFRSLVGLNDGDMGGSPKRSSVGVRTWRSCLILETPLLTGECSQW